MKIRVLVVDEAAFVRDSLKRVLRQFLKNVEVFDAVNGKRAMPLMHGNKMTLIISSWDMPEMSGDEFLAWVRSQENFAKTPFIVMADGGDRKSVEAAVKAGANDFLAKPFTPDEVQKRIVKQLTRIGVMKKPPSNPHDSGGSLGALTGGSGAAAKAKTQKKREVKSAAGFGLPAATAKPKASKPSDKSGNFDGTAQLNFEGYSIKCKIRELSLTGVNGLIQRTSKEEMPHIFDTAAADIANSADESIGNFNVYVHSLQASDPNPNAKTMRITLRFANNSPDQFEPLSKAIARGR